LIEDVVEHMDDERQKEQQSKPSVDLEHQQCRQQEQKEREPDEEEGQLCIILRRFANELGDLEHPKTEQDRQDARDDREPADHHPQYIQNLDKKSIEQIEKRIYLRRLHSFSIAS